MERCRGSLTGRRSPWPGGMWWFTLLFLLGALQASAGNQDLLAFYFPFYRALGQADGGYQFGDDSSWYKWDQCDDNRCTGYTCPGYYPAQGTIASTFWPSLDPYSSSHRDLITTHLEWMRQANVGVIVVSWWGKASTGWRGDAHTSTLKLFRRVLNNPNLGFKIAIMRDEEKITADEFVTSVDQIYTEFINQYPTVYWKINGKPAIFHYGDGRPAVSETIWMQAYKTIRASHQDVVLLANGTLGAFEDSLSAWDDEDSAICRGIEERRGPVHLVGRGVAGRVAPLEREWNTVQHVDQVPAPTQQDRNPIGAARVRQHQAPGLP